MSPALNILLLTYSAIVLINCVLSAAMWYSHRDEYNWQTLKLWVASALTFTLQGFFLEKNLATVLAFSTTFLLSLQLTRILAVATDVVFPERYYKAGFLVGAVAAIVAARINGGFTAMAVGPALAIALPIFHAVFHTIRLRGFRGTGMVRIYFVLLVLYGFHFLDYPVIRPYDALSLFGFAVALALIFCLSIFLPTYGIAQVNAKYSSELERKVAERTESLVSANAELKKLSDEHDHLLRLLVHDIANPLMIASMNMENLERAVPATGPATKTYDRIKAAMVTVTEVLGNVRDLHALRTGKTNLSLFAVSIADALEEQAVLFEPRLRAKSLKLRIEQKGDASIAILAEPTSLRHHVLANLISNAIKFSEAGGEIVLTVEETVSGVRLCIADQGIGMPAEMIPRLFDMKAETSRRGTAGEKGTGFGMPIVKTFLDRYGARIEIRSEEKTSDPKSAHGTEFQIEFKKAA